MSIILITGMGLGIGGFIGWLVKHRPHLLVSAESLKKNWIKSQTSLTAFLCVTGLALNFYGLGTGDFSISQIACYGFLLSAVWAAAFFDLRYRLIPNRLVIVGIAGWFGFALSGVMPFASSLLAGLCAALSILLIRLVGFLFYKKAGMGIGDVKLVLLMGLFLQWEIFWAVYLAVFTGGLWAITGLSFQKLDRKSRLPFAPFLWVAVSIAVFFSFSEFMTLWM